jgi:hypothetical protein
MSNVAEDLYLKYDEYEEISMSQYRRIPGTEKTVYLSYPTCCDNNNQERVWIESRMQDHEGPPNPEVRPSIHVEWNYERLEFCKVADPDWALDPNTLPSIDQLIGCRGRNMYHGCSSGVFAPLHIAFSDFGEMYCRSSAALPLVFIHRSHLLSRI